MKLADTSLARLTNVPGSSLLLLSSPMSRLLPMKALRSLLCLAALCITVYAQDPASCASACAAVGEPGCCDTGTGQCLWFAGGYVTDGAASGEASANCHAGKTCDGWNWGKTCSGNGKPVPQPGPTPAPAPIPPGPAPSPSSPANPAGDGNINVNLFASSQPWVDTRGSRVQAHSGMVFQDTTSDDQGEWVLLGNSDPDPQVGGGDNAQISYYRAPELYGPWGPEQVLLTIAQANQLPGMQNVTVGIMERPKIAQRSGYFYLFLHLEPPTGGYTLQSLGLYRFKVLAPPSADNVWECVFVGRPGLNKRTGQGFRVLDFGLFDDPITGKILYTATTDSYRFPGTCCISDPPGTCNFTKTNMCATTALVTFDVDLQSSPPTFTPVVTLPGRWEAPTLFRDPGDANGSNLYMMCSGQDGFGPNPVGLFSTAFSEAEGSERHGAGPSDGLATDYPWPAPTLWKCLGLPHSGSGNAFNTQPFQVLPNPYSAEHGIYLGDNWLHGPGKRSDGECDNPAWHGMSNCEPWQGNCPCNYPNNKCPGTSSPGFSAGYAWLPFTWEKLRNDPLYLICAHSAWNMKAPPADDATCYTFNVFPDAPFTPGLDAHALIDYRGQHVPYVESSCGFIPCPGWPMTKAENTGNSTACCEGVGDAITQARNGGRCRADDLCNGACKEDENENIPGGHGGCTFSRFDSSKAKLIGSDGTRDCTQRREGTNGAHAASGGSATFFAGNGSSPGLVDPCRGDHATPS